MSMIIVLVLVAIVTLSEFVAEGANKRVEIFAGQIFDLACAKIPSWYSEGGIAVHGTTDTWRCYCFKKQFFFYGKDVQTSAIPLGMLRKPRFSPLGFASTTKTSTRPSWTGLLRVTIWRASAILHSD